MVNSTHSNYSYIKLILFSHLFFLISFNSYSQKPAGFKVTGNVVTADGKPAGFVTVSLKDTFYGGSADDKGNFSFEAPAGSYIMEITTIYAHRREIPVDIVPGGDNCFKDISIMENARELETVVVTGQFSPQSLRNSVYKVRVIGADRIEEKAAPDIQSLLNTEIGIRLSNDMALGETDFELMGMSGNNVKVLIDGVPVIDRGSNKQSLSQIDINNVERVEIVEGPMSVVYGTDALAGVINIITKKDIPVSGKNKYTVSANVQEESVGNYNPFTGKHLENIHLGWAGKIGIYANAGFTHNSNAGWKGDKTGREYTWQPKDQLIYTGTVGYKKEELNIWYRWDYLDETIDTPSNGTELIPEEVSNKKYITDRRNNQLQLDWKINNRVNVNFASSYQNYERRTRTTWKNTDTGEKWLSEAESDQDTSRMQSMFARATVTWRVAQKLTLQPGAEYEWTKGSGARIKGSPSISDVSVFLSAEWKALSWLDIRPGVRAIVNSDYEAPLAIPSLLTKFSLTHDLDLRLSYGYGFRAPTIRELYFSFHNANHDIDGNPKLKAEHSNNFSGALTWRALHGSDMRLTSTISGFYNDFRNRIETVITDASVIPMKATYGNISKYKTVGFTLENAYIWRSLGVNLGVSLIGRYNNLYKNSAYSSENMSKFRYSPEVSSSVTYKFDKTGTELSLFYKFTGAREEYRVSDDEITLTGLGSYHWADFTVSQKIWDYFKLSAGVKNIFDVTMVTNTSGGGMGSSGNRSYVGYGRSVFLGLNIYFTK